MKQTKFPLGQVVAAPGVLEELERTKTDALALLRRHHLGDWGDLGDGDKEANNFAITHGNRILSAYNITDTVKIWIITEADRSSTTLLLPSEY